MMIAKKIESYIEKSIREGNKNRYSILYNAISDDYEMIKILKLYKMQKGEETIAYETGINVMRVREIIQTIDQINRMIDSKMYRIRTENNKTIKETEKNTSNSQIRKRLDKIFLQYMEAKSQENIKRMNLNKKIDDIVEMVDALGKQTMDMLILASIYNDLGKPKEAYDIVSEFDPKELSKRENVIYEKAKLESICLRNVNFIEDLCASGKTYEEILNLCEKQPAEYRRELTIKFVKKVIENFIRRKKLINSRKEDNNYER